MKRNERSVIYAQDVMVITGRSRSYAYNVIRKTKDYFQKPKHQLVTCEEYAEFHGIPVEKVMEYISPES